MGMPTNTVETRNIQNEHPSLRQLLEKHAELEAQYHSTRREEDRISVTVLQRQIEAQTEYLPLILHGTSREIPNISSATPARNHLWQAYTFPDKSGGTLGIYLQGLGPMNQVKIDKLLHKLFYEAGESMEWPAFEVHFKMGGRHAAARLTRGVPGQIQWFQASITYIVEPADSVQQAQPPEQPDGKSAETEPRLEPADAVLQAQPPERLDGRSAEIEPNLEPVDSVLQAQPPERLDGRSAESEPSLEPADAVLQAQPPERLDDKSVASEGAADSVLQA